MSAGTSGRADADRREPEHLDHAEDAGEHVVRNRALNERQPGDVDERVADSDAARSATTATATSCQRPIAR